MTDLVSRLRERHSFLCDEAAEEIERLHGIIADNSLLNRTDNERLRDLPPNPAAQETVEP